MNKVSKTILVAAALALAPAAAHAAANVNPSSVLIKMLEMRVSPNADCSNAVSVFLNASPVYQDFISNPILGSGSIPLGTYNCLMIHISDNIKFSPASNLGGACQMGTVYPWDVCWENLYSNNPTDYYQNPDGTTVNCQGGGLHPVEDFPWIYFSTTGTQNPATANNDHEAGYLPTPSLAFTLSSALVVTSNKTLTFVWDFDNRVYIDTNGLCEVNPPNIFFR